MGNIQPTKEALLLNEALQKLGIETVLEHWDGHKHVDIFIPKGKLYIEVDGIQHLTSVNQIMSDFQRDHYSDDEGFHTMRIPSMIVEEKAGSIAKAITKILNDIDTSL